MGFWGFVAIHVLRNCLIELGIIDNAQRSTTLATLAVLSRCQTGLLMFDPWQTIPEPSGRTRWLPSESPTVQDDIDDDFPQIAPHLTHWPSEGQSLGSGSSTFASWFARPNVFKDLLQQQSFQAITGQLYRCRRCGPKVTRLLRSLFPEQLGQMVSSPEAPQTFVQHIFYSGDDWFGKSLQNCENQKSVYWHPALFKGLGAHVQGQLCQHVTGHGQGFAHGAASHPYMPILVAFYLNRIHEPLVQFFSSLIPEAVRLGLLPDKDVDYRGRVHVRNVDASQTQLANASTYSAAADLPKPLT